MKIENIIRDWINVDMRRKGTILKYFTPFGAHEFGQIGEDPIGTPNSLMSYITQVAIGCCEHLDIFGTEYDTLAGTGARDYIHFVDLALSHSSVLNQNKLKRFEILNIGAGIST